MFSLHQLIEKYGPPDALIDHWDSSSNRFAIWGFEEEFVITSTGKCLRNGEKIDSPPMDAWQDTLNHWKLDDKELSAMGYISYDLKNLLFPHIPFNNPDNSHPLLWFGKPTHVESYDISERRLQALPMIYLEKDIPLPIEYKSAIHEIKTYLLNGDSYQINFTQPKLYELTEDPLNIYLTMREFIRPHYGMYLNQHDLQILSFSPERFFRTLGLEIESFPMKGTCPRAKDIIQDKSLADKLYLSSKDRAEHLMIVDLLRNDLGKVCKYGSVEVNDLYSIHSFETVHQMVSRVFGQLQNYINETDIIKALFPGGSITGAPKERSMEIIDTLEGYQRGIYTGGLGYIQKNGYMDFNIAIRTMTIKDRKGIYPVGGGIVWDSDPLDEWREAHQKSKIFSPFIQKRDIEFTKLGDELHSN